jgi:hypothetical protein
MKIILTKVHFPGGILPLYCPIKFLKAHAFLLYEYRMLNLCVE